MSTPTIRQTPGGYNLEWADEKVRIAVSHVDTAKLRGRVRIYDLALPVGHQTVYEPTDLLLTGPRSRSDLVRQLAERVNSKDWKTIVGQLCLGLTEAIERGSPVVTLSMNAEPSPPQYAIYPLVVKGYANVFFGDPSAGKSQAAVTLAILLQTSWEDKPFGLTVGPPMRLLYLDWESDEATVSYALSCQCRGFGIEKQELCYKHLWPPLYTELSQIQQIIEQTQVDCLVIDSLTQAAGAGEHDQGRAAATAFFQALGSLGLTSIVLAHDQKSTMGKKSILGSQVFTALARNAWEVRKAQNPGEASAQLAFYHRKPPPFAGLSHPIGLRYDFDNASHTTTITHCDVREEPELLAGAATSTRIVEALKHGKMLSAEIAAELELPRATVTVTLSRLLAQGKVLHLGKEWGLLSKESED